MPNLEKDFNLTELEVKEVDRVIQLAKRTSDGRESSLRAYNRAFLKFSQEQLELYVQRRIIAMHEGRLNPLTNEWT